MARSVPKRGSNDEAVRLSWACCQSTTWPPSPTARVRYGSTHSDPKRGLGVGRPDDSANHPPAGHTGWPSVWTVTAPALVAGSSSSSHRVGVSSAEILGQTRPPTPTIISGEPSGTAMLFAAAGAALARVSSVFVATSPPFARAVNG